MESIFLHKQSVLAVPMGSSSNFQVICLIFPIKIYLPAVIVVVFLAIVSFCFPLIFTSKLFMSFI